MPIRGFLLFIVALVAWIAPLARGAANAEPALHARELALTAGVTVSPADELPPLMEEEDQSEIERQAVASSSEPVPAMSSPWSALPQPCLLPAESRIVSSATPRGPPAFAL